MTFNFDQIKEDLRLRLKEYMEIEGITFNRQNKCKCILSGHNDSDRKPNMSYDKKAHKVKCFKCNNLPMDIFEVIRELKGFADFKDQFTEACRVLNVQNPYDDKSYTATNKPRTQKTPQKPIELSKEINNTKKKFEEQDHEEKAKINAYIEKARGNIENKDCLAYLESRGLYNIDILKKYDIGYSIKTFEDKHFPSIITPNSIDPELFSFTGLTRRQLKAGITNEGETIEKGKNGLSGIFNLKALYQSEKPVFITEGEFNAFSILEITGGEIEGVSIGSTSNTQTLIDILKQRRPEAFIFLELDDDYKMQSDDSIKGNRGKEEQAKIEEYLKQANISFLSVNTVKACKMPDKEDKENNTKLIQCKDQSDALTYDRETFANEIGNILIQFKSIQEEQGDKQMPKNEPIKEQITAPEPVQEDKSQNTQGDSEEARITRIKEHLENSKINADYLLKEFDFLESRGKQIYKKTGFDNLDKILGGGLEPGLYLIGAVPGAGKSAFFQQIGENLADQGHNVLYISMEMSRHTLLARTVARILKRDYDISLSAKEILNFHKIENQDYKQTILKAYEKAVKQPHEKERGDLYLIDNSEAKSPADFISRDKLRYYVDFTRTEAKDSEGNHLKNEQGKQIYNSPVVIVDYVQILRRLDSETSLDKKSVLDKHMETLKAISMEFDIPVLVISSVNRDSYKDGNTKLTLASLKESGDIEYYAEVVFLLDYDRDYPDYKLQTSENVKVDKAKFDLEIAKKHAKKTGYSAYKIVIAKNRNGGDDESPIYFYGESTYFTESLLPEPPKQKQNKKK
jgi:replicative DNA helicase